jgi:TonB family protein
MGYRVSESASKLALLTSVVLSVVLSHGPALAQTSTSADADRTPRVQMAAHSYYPLQAQCLGITGRVGLEYSLDRKGRVRNIAVGESAGSLLDLSAKKLLLDARYSLPADWATSGDPEARFKVAVIFELRNKPNVPRFEDNRPTVVVTAGGISGSEGRRLCH